MSTSEESPASPSSAFEPYAGEDISRLRIQATTMGDLLLMPVMPQAVWSLQGLASAGRDADTVAARLRFTAPFDMSGHPTLTLPGGMTQDGMPVGFQIVGCAFSEGTILAAGHAYQQATDWHLRRPPLDA